MHLPLKAAAITTTKLKILVGSGITKEFGKGQPCEIIASPTAVPQISKTASSKEKYSPDNYFILDTPLALDIKCQYPDSEEFVQATTLNLDLNAHFNFNITYGVTVNFEIYDLALTYVNYTDSNIKTSHTLIQKKLNIGVGVIEGMIESFFLKGHSFQNILLKTPLCWLNINEIMSLPNYQLPYVWGGLSAEYAPERCPNKEPFGEYDAMLMQPETFAAQILDNVKLEFDTVIS